MNIKDVLNGRSDLIVFPTGAPNFHNLLGGVTGLPGLLGGLTGLPGLLGGTGMPAMSVNITGDLECTKIQQDLANIIRPSKLACTGSNYKATMNGMTMDMPPEITKESAGPHTISMASDGNLVKIVLNGTEHTGTYDGTGRIDWGQLGEYQFGHWTKQG